MVGERGGLSGPTRENERIILLDALRGFALFGVLLANLRDLTLFNFLPESGRAALNTAASDHWLDLGMAALVDAKAFTIFTLLFGVGFALQAERAAAAGAGLRRYARRLLVLFVIGAEKLSSITNWTDRNTCVLFGDGAGAAILRHRSQSTHGVISTHIGSNGQFTDILWMPGGGCRQPITAENAHQHLQTIHMSGKDVYKQAVISMLDASTKALEKAGLKIEDIACVIPHQANVRIIEAIAHRMNLPLDRFFINLDRYGNTSAAAVAIALDEANRSGRMKIDDYVLLVVFGGGLTWASSVIQW